MPVTGGFAALAALAALGLAAAARSRDLFAQGIEAARLAFPHFRIVPCHPSIARGALAVPGSTQRHPTSAPVSTTHASRAGELPTAPPLALQGPLRIIRRAGRVAGTSIVRHPLQALELVVLAMLGAANVVLVGVRVRVGRVLHP